MIKPGLYHAALAVLPCPAISMMGVVSEWMMYMPTPPTRRTVRNFRVGLARLLRLKSLYLLIH